MALLQPVTSREHYRYTIEGCRAVKTHLIPRGSTSPQQHQVRYLPGLEVRMTIEGGGETARRLVTEVGCMRINREAAGRRTLPGPHLRFSLSDRSGSETIELDDAGKLVSSETYYPFGGTAMCQAETKYKTKRYSGKERDVTGLIYYGYRYFMPWLMRWVNTDPAGHIDGLNVYRMVRNNPLTLTDKDGRFSYAGIISGALGITGSLVNAFIEMTRGVNPVREITYREMIFTVLYLASGASGIVLGAVSDQSGILVVISNNLGILSLVGPAIPLTRAALRRFNKPASDIRVLGKTFRKKEELAYAEKRVSTNGEITTVVHAHGERMSSGCGRASINGGYVSASHFNRLLKERCDYLTESSRVELNICYSANGNKNDDNDENSLAAKLAEFNPGKTITGSKGLASLYSLDTRGKKMLNQEGIRMINEGESFYEINQHLQQLQDKGYNFRDPALLFPFGHTKSFLASPPQHRDAVIHM